MRSLLARDGSGVFAWSSVPVDPNIVNFCNLPALMSTDLDSMYRATDPTTGRVTALWDHARVNAVNIAYMGASDFQAIDASAPASAYDYRRPAPSGLPADYYKEQTFAIKSLSDPYDRTIQTTMTRVHPAGYDKFLLAQVDAPVFGGATGHWNLFYQVRQVTSAPPGWPTFDPATFPKYAYLVRVELPADASGTRLTYTFDYNAWGEISEIRSPSGARTAYTWANEFIDAEHTSASSQPKARVLSVKALYPSPSDAPTTGYTWTYTHSRYPTSDDNDHTCKYHPYGPNWDGEECPDSPTDESQLGRHIRTP